jgi:hypothetical protein
MSQCAFTYLVAGFNSSCPGRTYLRLCRSIYGLSISPKVWYDHHFAFLTTKDGFKQKHVDKCLLYERHVVDDMGIATKNAKEVDMLIERLLKAGFELTSCEQVSLNSLVQSL